MQNQNKKTDSRKCEKYAKYEYEKLSYTETYGVLQSLREDEVFCDIKLETDDHKIILAHKVVLASESPYFYSMFTKFSKKNHDIVVMREIHSTALQLLVNFIYSGYIVVTGENVQDLLPVANLLQLQEVKEVCCDFLQTQLCPTNCIGIYDIADLHSCTKLLTNSELYIQQHFSEVAGGDEFLSLSSEKLIKLISTDKLNVPSEKKVFESVIRWVKHELDLRNGILPQLMEHVRLPLTSESYILKEVVEEPLIKNCVKCKDYISEALNFHRHRSEEPIPQNIRNNPRHEDKVILVVGRCDMKLNTLFYDPKMNRWHDGPKMIQSRKNASLALVKDNLVFAVGGSDYRGNALLSVDVLDLSSESPRWESSKTMFVEQNITGVGVINDNIYVVGGFNFCDNISDSAKVFDYNTQKWRMISTMCTLRYDFAVGVLNDLLYVVGDFNESLWEALDTVECYHPSLDKWTEVEKMCEHRRGAGVGVLGGVLYAVGGLSGYDEYNCMSSVEAYRPSTDIWTPIADMNFPRHRAGVVALDGLLYVIGGIKGSSEDSTECYNPKTNTWTTVAPLRYHEEASVGVVAINRTGFFKTC
ncbi:kelch-like protein 2 isoform X2 [Acyrthosiphon pisum]|uniref:Kelch-like protein diablo n=1 Tax=Acyrthosiphon pisum TaxID=7029 RepID=A0A8R2AFU2_ACYPI|nr:kelch-like protein 2 isoform X2 [Acyrthosiphon pisum]|eukprot:XP_003242520.1 PREDICTED: kelch-like protein 2 isoform X2 [Acyrthosiphon pisum]